MTIYIATWLDNEIYTKEISKPKNEKELMALEAKLDKKYHAWNVTLQGLKKKLETKKVLALGTSVTIPNVGELEDYMQEFYTEGREYKIVGCFDGVYEVSDDSDEGCWFMTERNDFEVVRDEKM